MHLRWLLVLLAFIPFHLNASSIDGKKVTFARLLEELTNREIDLPSERTIGSPVAYHSKKDFVILRDVEIVFDRAIDNPLDQRFANGGKPIIITKGVEFVRCKFPELFWYLMRNVVFEDIVGFRQCTQIQAIFKDVTFKHHLYIYESQITFFEFEHCRFDHGFDMAANAKVSDHLSFKNCAFSLIPEFIAKPRVNEAQNVIKNLAPVPPLFRLINRVDPFDLKFDSCQFSIAKTVPKRDNYSVDLSSSQFNSFALMHSFANVPINFSYSFVTNQLSVHNCNLEGKVLAEAFNFSTGNAKLQWKSFSGNKIAVYNVEQKRLLSGDVLSEINNDFYFNTLISTYALFYTTYRQQGNRLSANACYQEWKDVETAYLAHLNKSSTDFQLYFSWLMNVFLKTFCDYGTNPIKSMVWSFYVMIGFALFYFFFPKQSGVYEHEPFHNRLKKLGQWFTEKKNMSEILNEDEEQRPTDSSIDFQEFISQNRASLPLYYRFFGRWNAVSSMYSRIEKKVISLFGRWIDGLSERHGFYRSLASGCFLVMIFFLLFIELMMRMLDSLTTSLNAFSTLGFGEIPVRGVAKYLAVIEGFIGWFLLSIFSVALISQIIQ